MAVTLCVLNLKSFHRVRFFVSLLLEKEEEETEEQPHHPIFVLSHSLFFPLHIFKIGHLPSTLSLSPALSQVLFPLLHLLPLKTQPFLFLLTPLITTTTGIGAAPHHQPALRAARCGRERERGREDAAEEPAGAGQVAP